MEVYVTGKQWMWQFAYPDGRGDISVLTVPVNRPVKLNMISRDVIHSFSVPAFRIKQDVLPGRYMTAWFTATKPGVYEILCAEFCGVGHSNMWGNVVVLSPGDYELWERGGMPLALQRARELTTAQRPVGILAGGGMLEQGVLSDESTTLAELGRIVAVKHACFACHTVDGRIHIGPTWSGLYGAERRLESGAVVHADPSYLTESMMDPRAQVVAGFAPVMPSYQGLLSGAESAALVEYIKSLRDQEATNTRIPTTAKD
jgi:cytochrome c oxidase subunit 2